MHQSVIDLIEFARSHVTEQDVCHYASDDPGPGYVPLWTNILTRGEFPERNEFGLTSVIFSTGCVNDFECEDPAGLRRFRRLTNAVALRLLHLGADLDYDHFPPSSALALGLIADWDQSSREHLNDLRSAFLATRDILELRRNNPHYPFFTFGSMILAQYAGDNIAAENAASRLIQDEAAVRADEELNWMICDDRFLLASISDRECSGWLEIAGRLGNPTRNVDIQLILDALVD